MNYIDVKEAVKLTGMSDKTIRRLLAKEESKPYLDEKDSKKLVEVNYLLSCFPAINDKTIKASQKVDNDQDTPIDMVKIELETKLALAEQQIQFLKAMVEEKKERIQELNSHFLLLGTSKEEKKKSWWPFTL